MASLNFAAQIDAFIADPDVDIIVDDLTYLKEPYYSDGYIAQAAEAAVAAGNHTTFRQGILGTFRMKRHLLLLPVQMKTNISLMMIFL